eukprot:5417174-Pyramimonas_sp.AAC.1
MTKATMGITTMTRSARTTATMTTVLTMRKKTQKRTSKGDEEGDDEVDEEEGGGERSLLHRRGPSPTGASRLSLAACSSTTLEHVSSGSPPR